MLPRETLLVLSVVPPQLATTKFRILFRSGLIYGTRRALKLGGRALLSNKLHLSLSWVFDLGVLHI